MLKRAGIASLPLHSGRVPLWLAGRMAGLSAAIVEVIVLFEGPEGFLKRLADPFWFQAFGAVLGMDWHSSGITTSVMGALKRGLAPRAEALGLYVCGGRGRHSRHTPSELLEVAEATGLNGDALVRTSKLVAKVDNTAIQDGFSLYLHSFVVTKRGDWVVVQQGMNANAREARRYHWRSATVTSFVNEPHEAVVGPTQGVIVNLTDHRAEAARDASVQIIREGPDAVKRELLAALRHRYLQMPAHHDVRPTDVFLRRLHGVIALAHEQGAADFETLLLTNGLGPRTMQALALISEVTFGASSRFDDPARFSFALGGKDGHPYPVPLRVYDQSIQSLRNALERAKVGRLEKIEAFRRLDIEIKTLEQRAGGPDFYHIVNTEQTLSPSYDGMTVHGSAEGAVARQTRPPKGSESPKQLKLFI